MTKKNFREGLTAMAFFIGAALLQTAQAGQPVPNLPQFDKVIHGKATIAEPTADKMKVTGNGKNSVLRWKSFDIAKGNTVYFEDGNFLNLIKDRKASEIYGKIDALGCSVYFVNPYGINMHKGSSISASNIGFSTAKPTADMVKTFINSPTEGDNGNLKAPQFTFTGKGMGKVRLLDRITAESLWVDAGQIIIRDANLLQTYGINHSSDQLPSADDLLKDNHVHLQSSVNRIDVGFSSEEGNNHFIGDASELNYDIKEDPSRSSLISHAGEKPLSDADDFANFKQKDGESQKYWLTNNVELELEDSLTGDKAVCAKLICHSFDI